MKIKKRILSKRSVTNQMKRILIISFLLIAIDIFISFIVLRNIGRQNYQYLSNMAELYIQEQDHTFFKLSRQLLSILMGNEGAKLEINETLAILESSSDPLEINVAKAKLKKNFLEYTWDYGMDYLFFAYLEKNDMYISLNSMDESVPDLEYEFRELLKQGILDTYSAKAKWTFIELESGYYILKVMHNNGRYFGCYLKADNLLKSLEKLNFTEHGFAILVSENHQLVTDCGNLKGKQQDSLDNFLLHGEIGELSNFFVIEKEFKRAPFRVMIFVDNFGIYKKYFVIQVALIILGASILGTLTFIMQYVQRRVLRPIQQFADNLLKYDDSDHFTFDITSNEIKELEQANEQFRNLLRQIKRLKITLYENELNKQRIQMDYLQLQIKPHFYLNCLNLIYQMIELGYYEDAKKMSVVTSDYLRYLFQSSMDFVEIRSELEHVENYLEIQKMRYQGAFTYYIEQDEETFGCRIPPLMIHTFVENSIGHTVSFDHPVDITILVCAEVYQGQEYVHISISDTGVGFPEEVLQQLNKEAKLEQHEDGHRIGITNCIKRMQYFYQNKGIIEFYNNPLGGAVVDMYLPVRF